MFAPCLDTPFFEASVKAYTCDHRAMEGLQDRQSKRFWGKGRTCFGATKPSKTSEPANSREPGK
jgi:hypothetical protein